MNENNFNQRDPQGEPPKFNIQYILLIVIAGLIAISFYNISNNNTPTSTSIEVPYNEFMDMVDEGHVDSVEIGDRRITIRVKASSKEYNAYAEYYTQRVDDDINLVERLREADVNTERVYQDTMNMIYSLANIFLPIVAVIILANMMMKRMGNGMGFGKSNAKIYSQRATGITFKDVAGEHEAKDSLS